MARREVASAPLAAIAAGCLLTTSIAPTLTAAAQSAAAPVARALAVSAAEGIRIDGRLDEPVWRTAEAIGPLTQREPIEGAAPSEATEVRVVLTATALVVGIECRDRDPRRIVATQLARDADLDVDDRVTIVIDPFLDHRNGFFFQINAAGARSDGQIANNAESLTREWDGLWNAAARVTDEGWVAEIEIPLKTLRFAPGHTTWGFNVERQIKRRQEIDRWAGARQNIWIGNLAEAGRLDGLTGLQQGAGLDVRPYVSGGRDDGTGERAVGVDVFKSVASNLNAALTVNTDFAETEADLRQINLTRFPLFYPEKRAFFLEGADVFDVAGLATSTELRPFFTRSVGLVNDVAIPIRVGAKLAGHQGDYNVGVLDVETGANSDPLLPGGGVDRQNLLAVRLSRNLFRQSWIGALLTNGSPGGSSGTLMGLDTRLATSTFRGSKNFSLDLYAFTNDAAGKRDGAAGFKIDYPNDRWDIALDGRQIGDAFQPALGFVQRAGIRKADLYMAFQPRPAQLDVRQFSFELEPSVITNLQNEMENWQVYATPFSAVMESGDSVKVNVIPEFERLDAPFAIAGGVPIPAGSYEWTRSGVAVHTATKRAWVVDAAWTWGGFYDGTRREIDAGVTLKPDPHLSLSARLDRNGIDLPRGPFTTQLVTARVDVSGSPNVSWSSLVQYDTESRLLGLQSRLRWILRPGNDVFVVLNRGWTRAPDDRLETAFDRAAAKLQYTFRW